MTTLIYPISALPISLERSWAHWENGFSFDELKKIVDYCETLKKLQAEIFGRTKEETKEYRSCQVAWLQVNDHTEWIYSRLAEFVKKINEQYFRFELTGFATQLQYLVYDGTQQDHIDWHTDSPSPNPDSLPRKLNCILQLSDPMDYEGGELWVNGQRREVLRKQKGLMHIFPSYTLHKVTPVTAGTRRSLLAWITGPEFR